MHPANAGHKNQGPIKNRLAASARLGVKERCEGLCTEHGPRGCFGAMHVCLTELHASGAPHECLIAVVCPMSTSLQWCAP
eukprot:1146263-Pelagomonas_calceolata.AAC.8